MSEFQMYINTVSKDNSLIGFHLLVLIAIVILIKAVKLQIESDKEINRWLKSLPKNTNVKQVRPNTTSSIRKFNRYEKEL